MKNGGAAPVQLAEELGPFRIGLERCDLVAGGRGDSCPLAGGDVGNQCGVVLEDRIQNQIQERGMPAGDQPKRGAI